MTKSTLNGIRYHVQTSRKIRYSTMTKWYYDSNKSLNVTQYYDKEYFKLYKVSGSN